MLSVCPLQWQRSFLKKKKRNSFCWPSHSSKVNMKELPLSKGLQNESFLSCHIDTRHQVSGWTPLNPSDIHVCPPTAFASIGIKISVCGHKEGKEGWVVITYGLSHLDLWGFLLLTFCVRVEGFVAQKYLLSCSHPFTLHLVMSEAAQEQSVSL